MAFSVVLCFFLSQLVLLNIIIIIIICYCYCLLRSPDEYVRIKSIFEWGEWGDEGIINSIL